MAMAGTPVATHEVLNQPPPLQDYNLYTGDRALRDALGREGGGWGEARLERFGEALGAPATLRLGDLANRWPPVLHTHDRFGHRIDEVEFHPAWHELLRLAIAQEVHGLPWREPGPGAHVVRAAQAYLLNQVESGVCCPIAMTFAAVPALAAAAPALASEWTPRILSAEYDPAFRPAAEKRGVLIGMAMTEKQGGSDVRANSTRAAPLGEGAYALTGHKWFCSAPTSDAFLTLAQAGRELTCFLLPRFRPDGTRNAVHIQRLKDKLGNRSNASAEIEYAGAFARRVGDEGDGVRAIIRMVHHTRLECAIGSAALLRQASVQALHHAAHRTAFQRKLAEAPLMQNVLADLALESEAALALVMRLARAFDQEQGEPAARHLARVGTAVAKYWICKRAPAAVAEALECLGGNGYVEECVLPRLYREAPVNSIWEGRATSSVWTCCARCSGRPTRWTRCWRRSAPRAAPSPAWTPGLRVSGTICAGRTRQRRARAGWSSASRWPCRQRCWSATRPRRWPTPSARRGWRAIAAAPFGTLPGGVDYPAITRRAQVATA